MSDYEYMILQMAAGTRVTMFNERMEHSVQDGWEPIMMSGDTTLNVMLRRPRRTAEGQAQAVAAATAAVARPAAVAAPVSPHPAPVAVASGGATLNQQ